jgi:uncharacterized protein
MSDRLDWERWRVALGREVERSRCRGMVSQRGAVHFVRVNFVRCHGSRAFGTLRGKRTMLGTLLNAGAILLGAILGCATKVEVSVRRQQQIKVLLGVATAFFGLKLLWAGLASGTAGFFHQFIIAVIAMIVGHLVGKLCRIQLLMNRIGRTAKAKLERASQPGAKAAGEGFMAATLLFCAAPLGIVGALEDGLSRYFQPLAIKAVMDGLAALSFARMFGWTAMLSAVPVAAFLSGLALLGERLGPLLGQHGVLGVVDASAGLLMTYVALIIFEVKRVEIGDYLPALVIAPALMKLSQTFFA